jgi:hypothetical protein
MAALHLIKLSVGSTSPASLQAWQNQRVKEGKELLHITRMTPKRAEELLNGGSIYWVIKGFVCARNRLIELRPMIYDGTPHCALVYDAPLIRVAPRKHRPFQGWRYFDGKNAPPDLQKGAEDMPEEMMKELAGLGLL